MPGFHIHLAIGNRYIEKHEIKEKDKFLEGIIAPDLEEKEKSHYTKQSVNDDLVQHLKHKVIIEDFIRENEIKTDYQKGVFLHLLTDKRFFTEFFSKEYLLEAGYKNFSRDLYYSYDETDNYIEKKYNLNVQEDLLEKINNNIQSSVKEKKGNNILPLDRLDEFIEKISDISIEDYLRENNF